MSASGQWRCGQAPLISLNKRNVHVVCEEKLVFSLVSFFVSLQGAKLPMSIIIVGVGQAEFDGRDQTSLYFCYDIVGCFSQDFLLM